MKEKMKKLLKDESAQGATEYILLLVAVVGMVILFKGEIETKVRELIGRLSEEIGRF